jgi:TonB family protein
MLLAEKRNRVFVHWARPFQLTVLLLTLMFIGTLRAQELSRKVIAKSAPSYPELAKRMHITGKVKLEIVVAPGGAVTAARLVGGNPVFEKSAVEAVKQWRFEPAQKETKTAMVLEFADQ